jgi:hypothetical protein
MAFMLMCLHSRPRVWVAGHLFAATAGSAFGWRSIVDGKEEDDLNSGFGPFQGMLAGSLALETWPVWAMAGTGLLVVKGYMMAVRNLRDRIASN